MSKRANSSMKVGARRMAKFGMRRVLLIMFSGACLLMASCSHLKVSELSPEEFAKRKMEEQQFSPAFQEFVLSKYNPQSRDSIVRINVQGFLKRADYSGHYSKLAVRKTKAFLQKHRKAFAVAEKRYGVPAAVIASLVWVETKFGATMGAHSVPGVYFSLLQSDHPELVHSTFTSLDRSIASEGDVRDRVQSKAKAKADWAMGELKALEQIYQQRKGKLLLNGSYAGAFGLPQFLPSSYLQWAKPLREGDIPNLFYPNDAISSIGFYLKANGWTAGDTTSQKEALFHYNRAEGYVNVILKIADAVSGRHSI